MFQNPRRGRQARNFTTNVTKILDLKSSSEQIFFRKLSLGAPVSWHDFLSRSLFTQNSRRYVLKHCFATLKSIVNSFTGRPNPCSYSFRRGWQLVSCSELWLKFDSAFFSSVCKLIFDLRISKKVNKSGRGAWPLLLLNVVWNFDSTTQHQQTKRYGK